MLIDKYIFVIFLSLFVISNFRGALSNEMLKGTWREKVWERLS